MCPYPFAFIASLLISISAEGVQKWHRVILIFHLLSFQTETLNLLRIIQPWMSHLGIATANFSLEKRTSLRLQPVLAQDCEDNHPLGTNLKKEAKPQHYFKTKTVSINRNNFLKTS